MSPDPHLRDHDCLRAKKLKPSTGRCLFWRPIASAASLSTGARPSAKKESPRAQDETIREDFRPRGFWTEQTWPAAFPRRVNNTRTTVKSESPRVEAILGGSPFR